MVSSLVFFLHGVHSLGFQVEGSQFLGRYRGDFPWKWASGSEPQGMLFYFLQILPVHAMGLGK